MPQEAQADVAATLMRSPDPDRSTEPNHACVRSCPWPCLLSMAWHGHENIDTASPGWCDVCTLDTQHPHDVVTVGGQANDQTSSSQCQQPQLDLSMQQNTSAEIMQGAGLSSFATAALMTQAASRACAENASVMSSSLGGRGGLLTGGGGACVRLDGGGVDLAERRGLLTNEWLEFGSLRWAYCL
jgi:hypothetical protein